MTLTTYLDPRETIFPGVVSGLCLAFLLSAAEQTQPIMVTSVVAWLCMMWWIFEPIPIPVTSLLPIAVFPLTGILSAEQVTALQNAYLLYRSQTHALALQHGSGKVSAEQFVEQRRQVREIWRKTFN